MEYLAYVVFMKSTAIRILLAVLLILLPAVSSFAIDLEIEYFEGTIEVQDGSSWSPLDIGDVIPAGSTFRLAGQGYAELLAGSNSITLNRGGTYRVDDLVDTTPTAVNTRQVLGSKFSFLGRRPATNAGLTAAAVRGAEAETDYTVTWEGDDEVDHLQEGISYFNSGDYVSAEEEFLQGSKSFDSSARECLYRLGLTQLMRGLPKDGRMNLDKVHPQAGDGFYGEYALTYGALMVEGMEFDKADKLLADYLAAEPHGDSSQAAWFLLGVSENGQGLSDKAQGSFRKAVDMDPTSDVGAAAKELLSS